MLSRMLSICVGRDDLADGLLDQIAEPRGLLDAGAGLGADVEDELAVVGGGEEVLAEERDQQEGAEAEQQEDGNEERAGARRGASSSA